MGLAASQARLLTITARLADNELRSQTINNAKMRLATQSSQASENYVNALNNATMKFTNYALDGESQTQNLTFNALTAYSSYNNQYGLINSSGQLLVSETEAALFEKSNGNLDAYLQYHGLNYETTYYEKVGNITNDGYIAPFNYITVEDMKTYFEQYNSYENSQEVEKYENAYNTYISSTNALENVSKTVLSDFFASDKNTPKVTKTGGTYAMEYSTNDLNKMLQDLRNAFANPNNTFAFNNPIWSNLVNKIVDPNATPQTTYLQDYNELLGSVTVNPDGSYQATQDCTLSEIADEKLDENTKKFRLDGAIDLYFNTVSNTVTEIKAVDPNQTVINGVPIYGFLNDAINSLNVSFKDDKGNVTETTQYKTNGTDENGLPKVQATSQMQINSAEDAQQVANEILNEILKDMESSLGLDFAKALYDTENPNAAANRAFFESQSNLKLSDPIKGSTKTLQEYYNDYVSAESIYFNTVFAADSIDQVKDDIANGSYTDADGNNVEISYRDLTNVDFVLRYMEAKGLNPSETFLTVIKEFVVDNIIDEYGTPKYAWIDSTDTKNEGNADAKAQWYTNLFNRMAQGYKALENGLASSPQWIEYALESGIVTMEQVDGTYQWQGLDYKACARITEETDDAAVAKAEAEYSRAMNDIKAKDNIYDLELKNIDTEHSSLQTEYDSIKGVISKNIERTFNFYKNA